MDEIQELSGVEAILQECGDQVTVTQNGYPFYRDLDAVKQAVDPAAMTADFVIVTRGKDANRNGCMVQIVAGDGGDGLILDNFKKNPVVLLNHGEHFALPIGASSLPILAEKKATATVKFSQVLPEAAQIFALIDEGMLRTASISYLPLRAKMQKIKRKEVAGDEDAMDFRGDRCIDFTSNDLLEWSVVTIPADPGAVRRFLELGNIRGEKLTRAIRQSLAPHAEAEKAFAGWTKERDEMLARIATLEKQAANVVTLPHVGEPAKQVTLPHKGEPAKTVPLSLAKPLSQIIGDALTESLAPHVASLSQRIDQSAKRVPSK